ncbi:MAG: hypothetical protein AAGD96_11040 [Chloroflexota bacterium]
MIKRNYSLPKLTPVLAALGLLIFAVACSPQNIPPEVEEEVEPAAEVVEEVEEPTDVPPTEAPTDEPEPTEAPTEAVMEEEMAEEEEMADEEMGEMSEDDGVLTGDDRSAQLASLTATWGTNWEIRTIETSSLLSGGPPRDGIPSIDDPQFISTAEADEWLAGQNRL